jgi:hypothetical protein
VAGLQRRGKPEGHTQGRVGHTWGQLGEAAGHTQAWSAVQQILALGQHRSEPLEGHMEGGHHRRVAQGAWAALDPGEVHTWGGVQVLQVLGEALMGALDWPLELFLGIHIRCGTYKLGQLGVG